MVTTAMIIKRHLRSFKYIDKQKKTFEERQGNSDVINDIIETFDAGGKNLPKPR